MSRNTRVGEEAWVDLFSGTDFTGRLHRLWMQSPQSPIEFSRRKLPKFRSIIVGPAAVVEIYVRGQLQPVRLSPKTLVLNTSSRLNGDPIGRLILRPVS
jgi:hypothetical protein